MHNKIYLSFKVDPPQVFHTYAYHKKRAEKIDYVKNGTVTDAFHENIQRTATQMAMILGIQEDYGCILLDDLPSVLRMLLSLSGKELTLVGSDNFYNIIHQALSEDAPVIHFHKALGAIPANEFPVMLEDVNPYTGKKVFRDNLNIELLLQDTSILHLDISYSAPAGLDHLKQMASICFRTQYGFGMGEDLVVWFLRKDLYDRVKSFLEDTGQSSGFLLSCGGNCLLPHALEYQKIYILGKIVEDMLNRGIKMIDNEITYKSIILRNAIENNKNLNLLVRDAHNQSRNIICAESGRSPEETIRFFTEHGIELDVYQGSGNSAILRMGNYLVHSKEQMEYLADILEKF